MKIRRKQRETRTHAAKWLLLVAAVALCFVAYQGVQGVLHVMRDWTNDLPSLASTDAFNYAQESTMYAGDNSTLLAEFQLEKRDPLTSADQVSPYVLKGTVDTEDVRFYEHTGVDLPLPFPAKTLTGGKAARQEFRCLARRLKGNYGAHFLESATL